METQHDAVLNIDHPGTNLTNRNNHSEIDTKQLRSLQLLTYDSDCSCHKP